MDLHLTEKQFYKLKEIITGLDDVPELSNDIDFRGIVENIEARS